MNKIDTESQPQTQPMPKLFISYRRQDSADATGRLYDRLRAHFGSESIFYDVDTIPVGVDFRKHLSEQVGKCDIFLAIIGEQWLSNRHEDGPKKGQRRLDDPTDWVRIEIEAALARKIPVVPVLVGRARMPSQEELPNSIREIVYRQNVEVRSDANYASYTTRLIRSIERIFDECEREKTCRQKNKPGQKGRADKESERPRDGQIIFAEFVHETLSRTCGSPTQDDIAALGELIKEYGIPPARATHIAREVQKQFIGCRSRDLRRVRLAGLGLVITGVVNFVFTSLLGIALLDNGADHVSKYMLVVYSLACVIAISSGVNMHLMRRRKLVLAGSVVSILVIGALPFAIFGLTAIRRRAVRAAFDQQY